MRLSVLVTSFQRPDCLKCCLDSLFGQQRLPDELIIVVRDTDSPTRSLAEAAADDCPAQIALSVVSVVEPGAVAANNAGLPSATGDVVCFIDDDAVASDDWLARIESCYQSDRTVGGVGGRDIIHLDSQPIDRAAERVGEIRWFGKVVGNHSCRTGGLRTVDHLKGCNMSFRRELIQSCDESLGGDGYAYELDLSLSVGQLGYQILYDGTLTVDHFPAARFFGGSRNLRDRRRLYWQYHNLLHVGVKRLHGVRLLMFLGWYLGPHLAWQIVHTVRHRDFGFFVTTYGMMRGICSGIVARFDSHSEREQRRRELVSDTKG